MTGRVLIAAGSDSSGGAGIQADLKTVMALGGYAMTAITALTAQNTQGVFGIHAVPPAFIIRQMTLALDDLGADAVKTGMLATAEVIAAVAQVLADKAAHLPLVVDPVMVSTSGAKLLASEARQALVALLIARATVITPNLPEAEALLGRAIPDAEAMAGAATELLALGARAVLLKGGHLVGPVVVDVLAGQDGTVRRFESPRIVSASTHGTGCTLASAVACGLAQGMALADAVARGRDYVARAIAAAPGLGRGHGPLGHGVGITPPG